MTESARSSPASRTRPIEPLDRIMLLLALISIGLLAYETWGPVTAAERSDILLADAIICAIFALEFLWQWGNAGWRREFVWRNWYEILGMIPISHPAIRGFRLFRLLRIAILLARFGRAADRALGEDFTYRLVRRFRGAIVEAIRESVTLAVLDDVAEVLRKGHYTRNVARALEENRGELHRMAVEKLLEDPRLRPLARLPFYGDLSAGLVNLTLRLVEEFLQDPRTDELIADVLRENLVQIRAAVKERQAERSAAVPRMRRA